MSTSVRAHRRRASRRGWFAVALILSGGTGAVTLAAIASAATENLMVSLASRPKAIDAWGRPADIREASLARAPRRVEIASADAGQMRVGDDLFDRVGAAARDGRLAALGNRLAAAPLMFDGTRSAWRQASVRTTRAADSSDAALLNAAPAAGAQAAAATLAKSSPRWDVAFVQTPRVIPADTAPQLASAIPELESPPPPAAAPEPRAVQLASLEAPSALATAIEPDPAPIPAPAQAAASVEPAPEPAVTQPAHAIPVPTPRPADFARMAQLPPARIVPILAPSAELAPDAPPTPPVRPAALAYAAPEIDGKSGGGVKGFFDNLLGDSDRTPALGRRSRIAVYDIASATVRLPNGERLEAHSGLGYRQDDPRYVREKNRGPTPPNVYSLVMRERRFHGAEAIRLLPFDQKKVFNRDGLLAHPYMYAGGGSRSQSNGCVVFKDYSRFLRAFKAGEIARLIVVPNMDALPTYTAGL